MSVQQDRNLGHLAGKRSAIQPARGYARNKGTGPGQGCVR